jgi:hypothetical protein
MTLFPQVRCSCDPVARRDPTPARVPGVRNRARHAHLVSARRDRASGEALIDEPVVPQEAEAPPRSRPRWRGALATAVILAVAAVGIALLGDGIAAFGRADDARDRTAELRRHRRVVIARTDAAERVTDAPISGAERVANSVGTVVEATDKVIVESGTTNQFLSQAVRLANDGNRGAANRIYEGDASASVQRLQEALTRAEAALAAAEQASTDLDRRTR